MVSYDADTVSRMTTKIAEAFSKEFLAQRFAFASDGRSPVFIVGMPRSGTTLMASILSAIRPLRQRESCPLSGSWRRALLSAGSRRLTPAEAARMIKTYEGRLRRGVDANIPYAIDKHPLNFRHLGLIAMLFPKAAIIHCTRNAMDTGLSNYFQRFASYYDYAFDLGNIGHFYREYARLMEHWRKVLPISMIEVSYEGMVMHTERVARSALDALGLQWDARCLAPHANPIPVETASQWQVRQPIYHQSIGRWRHYEKYLGPLKASLRHPAI